LRIVRVYRRVRQDILLQFLIEAMVLSLIGGLIGAIALTAMVPFARPLILAFGSPELFMLTLLGLSLIGVLSGNRPLKGMLAAALGLTLGTVGGAPVAAEYRFAGDFLYLYDGLSLVIVALGLFALPEIIDLLAKGGAIAQPAARLGPGWREGVRDTWRHKWLVLRHSLIGVGVGAIPGLGSSIIDWINYGLVARTAKDRSRFGQGDVRGVIAPESANNAKEGGVLMPTLLFGVPGSSAMALLLAALAGCSDTPLGERLAGSFGAPATPAAGAGATPGAAAPGPAPAPSKAPASPASPAPPNADAAVKPAEAAATKSPEAGAAKPAGKTASKPAKPVAASAAYRITIKLPGADPSAPAEVVTEALRAAGVSFEVETIERMPSAGGAGTSTPTSSPAPAPR
jgi:hypothetical protein